MTPSKKGKTASILVQRVPKTKVDERQVHYKAGGQHTGLFVNKYSWFFHCIVKTSQTISQHLFINNKYF